MYTNLIPQTRSLQSEVEKANTFFEAQSVSTNRVAYVAGWVESAGLAASDDEIAMMLDLMTGQSGEEFNQWVQDMEERARWLDSTHSGIPAF